MDFLPASLATIISYLSAETTRGIWKPVLMDGIDWPSPALNLVSFESEIEEILKTVGVHLPGTYAGNLLALLFTEHLILFLFSYPCNLLALIRVQFNFSSTLHK